MLSSTAKPARTPTAKSPESFASVRRRNEAVEILQSYEKLSWFSLQRCESLTQTRLHFQNIAAGFTAADEESLIDWKEDTTPPARHANARPDPNRKGKQRLNESPVTGAGKSSAMSNAARPRS